MKEEVGLMGSALLRQLVLRGGAAVRPDAEEITVFLWLQSIIHQSRRQVSLQLFDTGAQRLRCGLRH